MLKIFLNIVFVIVLYEACFSQNGDFTTKNNKILLILGQDLGAIGGFSSPNNNGYYENIGITPAGTTTYTSLPTLNGLEIKDNWGAGDICAQCIVDNPIYQGTVLAIGLDLAYGENLEQVSTRLRTITNGGYDEQIQQLAKWIKSTKMPVFLRIGYEFDGAWNNYNKSLYKSAFQRIVSVSRNITDNFVSVWQSTGRFDSSTLLGWYPGDDYVDWLGYSHFDNNGKGIIDIARDKGKPVIIAEATPKGRDLSTGDPNTHWNAWFSPFFQHIYENIDVIKAVAYINQNWNSQSIWSGQGWGNSKVQVNETIKQYWIDEITSEKWLNKSDNLYNLIGFDPTTVGFDNISRNNTLEGVRITTENNCIKVDLNNSINGKIDLTIYTITGKIIKKYEKYKHGENFHSTLQGFNPKRGMYFLRLQLNNKYHTKKFVTH